MEDPSRDLIIEYKFSILTNKEKELFEEYFKDYF